MQDKHTILGVHVTDRLKEAVEVQRVLTEFGGMVRTRLGLHEVEKSTDSPAGVLLLEVVGEDAKIEAMSDALAAIEGVEVKSMVFEHP